MILLNLLSSLKGFFTPSDYRIVSEELEYTIDYGLKYRTEDPFWEKESKDWDGVLDEFYINATGKPFRNTIVPENIVHTILRVSYYFNGRIYKAISNTMRFRPGHEEGVEMYFSIPLSSAWLVDHDDKPMIDITEKVKRYAGPRNDFHGQRVPLEDFLYYDRMLLEDLYPKILLTNVIGMKKTISTLNGFTTDLQLS